MRHGVGKLKIHTFRWKSFLPPQKFFTPLFSHEQKFVFWIFEKVTIFAHVKKRGVKTFEGGKKLFHRKVWTFSFPTPYRTLFYEAYLFLKVSLNSKHFKNPKLFFKNESLLKCLQIRFSIFQKLSLWIANFKPMLKNN